MDIDLAIDIDMEIDSKELEDGCRMIYAGLPSFLGLWFKDNIFQLSGACCVGATLQVSCEPKARGCYISALM